MFGRIFVELAKGGGASDEMMIDATHLKAHRTAVRIPGHPATHSESIRPPVTRCHEAAFFGYQV